MSKLVIRVFSVVAAVLTTAISAAYAGDGVMVVFNDPVPVENPALQAVQMALKTREVIGR